MGSTQFRYIIVATSLAIIAPPIHAQRAGGSADSRPEVAFKTVLPKDDARIAKLKRDAIALVDSMARFTQQMVDQVFSFGELGFQEIETSRYLTGVLEKNGFTVQRGVAGIPTAWLATWGAGKPVIALGSDIDGIPQASQKPGVSYHDPLIPGAPGHGEGHNSGLPVNITAAIAMKKIMERDGIPGTIKIWPGVAEELVGTKAYFVRAGMFRDADAVIFSHVGSNLEVSYGSTSGNGLVSVEFNFEGSSAHSAGGPWRGRSALDAVELMNIGWNYRREHLRLQQRSHYVVTNGGDQPNVVPPTASVWYYLRETDYPGIMNLWAVADSIAKGAAMMTGTKLASQRVLGSAWPGHFNKPIAEAMQANIEMVGLPKWDDNDQKLAKAVQCELNVPQRGLDTEVNKLGPPVAEADKRGGGSDDIGDISWNVPTVTLRFPSNIPNLPGHNWTSAIAMATPIAHKGATAGAKAAAATLVDLYTKPTIVTQAWDYFRNVQTKDTKYQPLIRPQDNPAIELNTEILAKYREPMRKFYYDSAKYPTYLEQLGIQYPTVRPCGRPVS
jgi:aminobenzoyl-glutamate utilization protein B